jgi:hypothetical protein
VVVDRRGAVGAGTGGIAALALALAAGGSGLVEQAHRIAEPAAAGARYDAGEHRITGSVLEGR